MILALFVLGACFSEMATSAQIGDCEGFENIRGRNLIFNKSFEVDPCAPVRVLKCPVTSMKNPSSIDNCFSRAHEDPITVSLKVLAEQQFNSLTQNIQVTLRIPLDLEFYIEAYQLKNESYDANSNERLGYFEDIAFRNCNSYACCNPKQKAKRDVARKCPNPSASSPVLRDDPTSPGFYSVSYIWHPPRTLRGDLVFVGTFIPTDFKQGELIKFSAIPVQAEKKLFKKFRTSTQRTQAENEPKLYLITLR